jgi:hypothetical protein
MKRLSRDEAFLIAVNIANPRGQKGLKPLTCERLGYAHRHSNAIYTH